MPGVIVFLAAGGEEDRRQEGGQDDGNDDKGGRQAHGSGLLAAIRVTKTGMSGQERKKDWGQRPVFSRPIRAED